MNERMAVLALALLALSGPAMADPFASNWAPSLKSEARLIADGSGQAGFQIELSPGSITYWRDPGDAGVPPTFDFSRSTNVASAEVDFPAPGRIAESDGSEAFGYQRGVVFPIRVQAADPSRPVTLALDANYAVCEKICLPARAALELNLSKGRRHALRRRDRRGAQAGTQARGRGRARDRPDGDAGAKLAALPAGRIGRAARSLCRTARGMVAHCEIARGRGRSRLFRTRPARGPSRRGVPRGGAGDHHGRGGRGGDEGEAFAQIVRRFPREPGCSRARRARPS